MQNSVKLAKTGQTIVSFAIAIFVLSQANSIIFLNLSQQFATIFCATLIGISIFLSKGIIGTDRLNINYAFAFLATYFVVLGPFRQHGGTILTLAAPAMMALIISLSSQYHTRVIRYLIIVLSISTVCSVIVFLFYALGISVPHIKFYPNFRLNPSDYYLVYIGTAALSTEFMNIGGINVFRLSAIFQEPGHYAMFSAALISIRGLKLESTHEKILFCGGFLTFSPAYYFFMLGAISLNIIFARSRGTINSKIGILISALVVILLFREHIFITFGEMVLVISSGDILDIFHQRERGHFGEFYASLNQYQMLVGVGPFAAESMGYFNAQSSDYRGIIVRSGFIGLLAIILLQMLYMHNIKIKRVALILLLLAVVILLHRSWMLVQLWFPYMLFCSIIISRPLDSKVVSTRRVDGLSIDPTHRSQGSNIYRTF